MRIAVADSDAASRKTVRRYLESRGHEVFEAELGPEVLTLIKRGSWQLVITELFLREMDASS